MSIDYKKMCEEYDEICKVCGMYCPEGGGAHQSCVEYVERAQQHAYAEGRKDERDDICQECIDIVAMQGGSVEIEAAIRALMSP